MSPGFALAFRRWNRTRAQTMEALVNEIELGVWELEPSDQARKVIFDAVIQTSCTRRIARDELSGRFFTLPAGTCVHYNFHTGLVDDSGSVIQSILRAFLAKEMPIVNVDVAILDIDFAPGFHLYFKAVPTGYDVSVVGDIAEKSWYVWQNPVSVQLSDEPKGGLVNEKCSHCHDRKTIFIAGEGLSWCPFCEAVLYMLGSPLPPPPRDPLVHGPWRTPPRDPAVALWDDCPPGGMHASSDVREEMESPREFKGEWQWRRPSPFFRAEFKRAEGEALVNETFRSPREIGRNTTKAFKHVYRSERESAKFHHYDDRRPGPLNTPYGQDILDP